MVPKNKKMLVVELEMKKERETKKMKTNTMMTKRTTTNKSNQKRAAKALF